MADEETPITFNIKSSNEAKYVLTLPLSTTVSELKTKLSTSEYADLPVDRQRLIYSGRVLKDPDTLGSYKLKDGNTIHLVKGAASNSRQNPASQNTVPTPGATPSNVPSNIAAGTGNNPLAGLTGARFAGHVQLPGAGMFGPDGGMGAPPDSDQIIDMLSDPNMQQTMNEALQNPQIVDMIMQQQPMFRNNPDIRRMFESPEFRRMMTDPNMLRQASQMQRMMGLGGPGGAGGAGSAFPAPGVTDTTPSGTTGTGGAQTAPNPFGAAAAGGNPFAALLGGMPPPTGAAAGAGAGTGQAEGQPGTGTQQPNATPGAGFPPMDPALMQQMMAAFGAGGGNPLNPFGMGAEPAQPPDTRPPEERYETQLRQLNDMGFYDFDRNIEALRRTGGSVQGAIEYLFSHQ